MRKKKIRRTWVAVFLSVSLWGAARSWAELSLSLGTQVHIQADHMEYLRDQDLVVAKGKVHIQQGSVHLYAESVRYDTQAQDILAQGNVVWQDETQEIEAQRLTYNLRTREGKATHIKTQAPPFISTGEEIEIYDKKIVIKNCETTTCDYAEGYRHYHMKADKITIYSGDYLVAENVVFYIGKVPVFYFPFFVRTIHDLKTPFSVSTGSTDYLGTYILVTTNYLFNPKSYGALYTDYFFKKGFGLGIRHEVALDDFSVLSLYGYGIPEKDDGLFRWEGRARGLWALSSNLQGRLEVDVPGDGLFSSDYLVAKRDPSLVSSFREYDLSATYGNSSYTLGLSARRQETADLSAPPQSEYHFQQNLQTLPQLNFSLFPRPLFGRDILRYDLTGQGDHTYTRANDFYVSHLTGELGLSQSLLVDPTQTFYGRVAMNESFQDVSDVGVTIGPGSAGETHGVNLQATWTSRWGEFFNSNFSYTFAQKLNNRSPLDLPTGVTANLLSGRLEGNFGQTLREATSTSFDFNAQVPTDGARFGYLHQELYWTASNYLDLSLFGNYSIQANGLKDLNGLLNVRSPHDFWRVGLTGNFVDPNFTNQGPVTQGLPKTFTFGAQVDMALFTNYRLEMIENYDLVNSRFQSRSISLFRDLHDWVAQINYTSDPLLGEKVFFTLTLKALPGKPLTVSDDQLQRLNGLRNQGLTGAASQFQ
ncbi:MAG TPA: LptA/OstA family protein [bacterium]|nr:LptA/OstA family protein [bacterium]